MTLPPLLLLDVDGVLNALGDDDEHLPVWPFWQSGRAKADGTSWPITWAPAVVDQLLSWQRARQVEIQWLTTWGHDANGELRQLLGMPELVVAGTYQEFGQPTDVPVEARSHAAVAPSAPNLLSGRWWKYDVVLRLLTEHPGRPVIWVDDELFQKTSPFVLWAQEQGDILPVGPRPQCGLSLENLSTIATALQLEPDAVPSSYGYPRRQ